MARRGSRSGNGHNQEAARWRATGQEGERAASMTELASEEVAEARGRYSGLYRAVRVQLPLPIPKPEPRSQLQRSGQGISESGWEAAALQGGEGIEAELARLEEASAEPVGAIVPALGREEVRVDVDGAMPQMTVSGAIVPPRGQATHWIARVKPIAAGAWQGTIWYRHGDLRQFPYTEVLVKLNTLGGGAAILRNRAGVTRLLGLKRLSPFFHTVDFEFDVAEGGAPRIEIGTYDHPDHPANLPDETLDIQTVYARAGFQVRTSPDTDIVLDKGAGADRRWSDAELHDAMRAYWSRFADRAQWAMWLLFARQHEMGPNLGGIMFDDIGPNHRQGSAVFTESFLTDPGNDPDGEAWKRRSVFFAAIHEMGHAFNLAHSWQKSLGTQWFPLQNEPQARSFMNYPQRVGDQAFFKSFYYRFSNGELLFLRHAPSAYVEPGAADWFDDHGFAATDMELDDRLQLILRMNRTGTSLEFLEPVVIEAKLQNVSGDPVVVPPHILESSALSLVVKREGQPARQRLPLARRWWTDASVALGPGKSIYAPIFASVSRERWLVDEPGRYQLQAALHIEGREVVSNKLEITVHRAQSSDELVVAQDYFGRDVGQVLAFDGSRRLAGANDALREVVDRFPEAKAGLHARVALAIPLSRDYRELRLEEGQAPMGKAALAGGQVSQRPADLDEAGSVLDPVIEDLDRAADTLGHIDLDDYVEAFATALAAGGRGSRAASIEQDLAAIMARRKVLDGVVRDIQARAQAHAEGEVAPRRAPPERPRMPPEERRPRA